ncbi:SigE family RNA polymerase sigma factor [Streptomyces aquilus]|uniref:SigE family RNA polymerase sigma factor n=1 Tax=Streptomyces aquilus TaxID=2548456 RepID=A0A3Q9C675_9ACTN|nr:SigE family RNA polymerase sigma factor [Streptomyces aquilus]AZP22666.1 SigE family RNA polymerase sigma factor [Streptomyces aquilus]
MDGADPAPPHQRADCPEVAFEDFVARRSAALFRGAYVLTGSREAAEDLVQETLERACRRWRKVAATESPEAYVRRIMVNLANDRWRRFRRSPRLEVMDEASAADEYARLDSRDQLVRALLQLPMGMRTVVVLRYFHDMPDTEIAADLGISATTVRSQLARGLDKLRAQLPSPGLQLTEEVAP